ncbi:MAG: isoprenylcysteine carboxylmethyltransferase family protein [Rhizobium sp.]|uniref:isoprenylcysteine carboxylmethyltransferase family protein n=1 Tax=Rhizobium sp. TaxID=391 RepID=UPI0030F36121
MKATMIHIGNFFFKYRNQVFPLIIVALFLMSPPPAEIGGSVTAERVKDVIALLVVFSGLALRATVIGYAYIQRGGLKKRVYASDLVTEGMFGVCRNPLYVGNMLVYAGVFLLQGNPTVVIVGIALFMFIYQCIVYAEEAFLEDKFGDAYRAYCADVPRWMLHFGNFAQATHGMVFNVKRVIAKDYSTVSAALLAVLLIEIYRVAGAANALPLTYISLLGFFIAVVGAATGMVSLLKKRGIFNDPKAIS